MINDPKFLLSAPNFSVISELQKTISFIQQDRKKAVCLFPARVYWILKSIDTPLESGAFEHCAELMKYINHVPFDNVALVFSSEVLSSASSMMGHVFIKASGKNYRNTSVEHAVSFFTEYQTINPAKILYDGIWGGMSGFFIVRPYQRELKRYLLKEGRNTFEYSLKLTRDEKRLLLLHMWELKDVDIKYLFQSYNCATLTMYVLGVARPSIKTFEQLFVSPADVIKAASSTHMINSANVNLANEWAILALELQLGAKRVEQLKSLVLVKNANTALWRNTLSELDIEYVKQLINSPKLKKQIPLKIQEEIASLSNTNPEFTLNLKAAKNPLTTMQDSALSFGLENTIHGNEINISFLPASHYLRTINSQFFTESQLHIGHVNLTYNTDINKLKLEQLTLYSFKSYMPTTDTLPQHSGSLFIGYKQDVSEDFVEKGFFTLEGGWGKSYRIHRDIIAYGIGNIGAGTRWSESLFLASLSSGMIINLAWESKLLINSEIKWTTRTEKSIKKIKVEFSSQASDSVGFFVNTQYVSLGNKHDWQSTFGVDWYF